MRKVIAAINMTIDGFCDHTYGIGDDELHTHYSELIANAGALLYGRKTYQLMEYWKSVAEAPVENQSEYDFALTIARIPKVVFSHTLKSTDWKNVRVAERSPEEEVNALKKEEGKDIYIGSPGLIASLTEAGLIDEYQLCIHPVIAGKGLPLFKNISNLIELQLRGTKTFGSGATILYYKRN